MIFFDFFRLIIKTLLEYNHPFARLLLAIILLLSWCTLVYIKHKTKKPFTILDYQIKSKTLLIFILSTFLIIYIFGAAYLRIINMQRCFNVYKISVKFIIILKDMTYLSLFANTCLFLALLLLVLSFIDWYKRLILKHYLQLHFLIISYYPLYGRVPEPAFLYWYFDDEQPYESLKYLVGNWVCSCRLFFSSLLKIFPETKIRVKIQNWFHAYYKLYGIMLIIILILFDILFNKGDITKAFYVMPLAFFYYLLCKYNEVLYLYHFEEEEVIVTFLYNEIVLPSDPGTLLFSNDTIIYLEPFSHFVTNVIPSKHK